MADRVRVRNTTPYDIGVMTQNGLGYNIKAKLFLMLNREDVEYIMAIAPKLFSHPAQLVVEDEELTQAAGIETVKEAAYDDATIEKILKGSASKLKTFVEENKKNLHVLEMLCLASAEMDLPVSKVKVLQEVMPQRDFMD